MIGPDPCSIPGTIFGTLLCSLSASLSCSCCLDAPRPEAAPEKSGSNNSAGFLPGSELVCIQENVRRDPPFAQGILARPRTRCRHLYRAVFTSLQEHMGCSRNGPDSSVFPLRTPGSSLAHHTTRTMSSISRGPSTVTWTNLHIYFVPFIRDNFNYLWK